MLGAIIGDIVGSRFEFQNIKTKEFDLFSNKCTFTDDTVMTLAVAAAILDCKGDYETLGERVVFCMRELGRSYPRNYGIMFRQWLYSDDPQSYNSFGNGAAMRVSACGFAAKNLEEALSLSRKVTKVTHNHPEGLKGAEASAAAVFLARKGAEIPEIRDYMSKNYYTLDFTLNEIRDSYRFDESCQGSVPQAITAFLESADFEDAIRNAISIGGDSDTLAAITGGIAEAYYGIPNDICGEALTFLDERLLKILIEFKYRYPLTLRNPLLPEP
jgi:type I restriction enzyme M protein